MAGSNNFKVFDETQTNIMDDSAYNESTYRKNGAVSGIAPSNVHNKLYRQTSVMAAALAQAMANKGYTVSDANFDNLVTVLDNIMTDIADNSVTDAKIGNRTITDTVTAAAGAGTITNLLSKIGNMIKRITGKSNWYTAPAITLEDVSNHTTATSAAHAASAISSTATGDVAATNVQAAITELASKKAALSSATFTGVVTGSLGGVSNTTINNNAHGAIELGDLNGTATAGSLSPFIDFHHAVGSQQDYNVRQTNDRDGAMTFYGNTINALEISCSGKLNGVRHGFVFGATGAYGHLDYDTAGSQVRLSALNNLVFGLNSNAAHNANKFTEYMRIASGGNIGINTVSVLNPTMNNGLRTFLSIKGKSEFSVLELGQGASDTNANGSNVGSVHFIDTNSTASDKRIASITGVLEGTTANNRGGRINFVTKPDNGTPNITMVLNSAGNLDVVGNINASTGVYSKGKEVAYIVAYGTGTGYYWRKWSNGDIEIFGTASAVIDVRGTVTFPITLSSIKYCNAVQNEKGIPNGYVFRATGITTAKFDYDWDVFVRNGAGASCVIHYHVVGT